MNRKIKLSNLNKINSYPVGTSFGVPWKKGELNRDETLNLVSSNNRQVPLQSRPLAFWSDGSVKWSGHSAVMSEESKKYYIAKGTPKEYDSTIVVEENTDSISVDTGKILVMVNKKGSDIIGEIKIGDKVVCSGSKLICIKEKRDTTGNLKTEEVLFESKITEVDIEQKGSISCVIKVKGVHINDDNEWLPFVLRLYFYAGTSSIKAVHTFIFDGDEKQDFIKGLGLRLNIPLEGSIYNRHVRLAGDTGLFSEPCQSISFKYEDYKELYPKQIEGNIIEHDGNAYDLVQDMAIWDDFKLIQDSSEHYVIKKRVKQQCAWIDCCHGKRSNGLAFVGSENGGLAVGVKDFWQKHPSAFEINGLKKDRAEMTLWFWSPDANAMDLRHYDTETHKISSYEGAEQLRSTPYGIANTNEVRIYCFESIPQSQCLWDCSQETQDPPILVCEPEYYHEAGAFGVWSLVDKSTPIKRRLEEQLDSLIEFYKAEVEQRSWYGFWHYGDFMHTYDSNRHTWKYDIGGFAWQNTELVPNMWLWYSFLRTGQYDIFKLAEAMTRHTSEVDVYHIGEYKGFGSRHNVIHWGCSAKEARIAMAGLHRFYYYLTADERIGDIMSDSVDADFSTLNLDPMQQYYPKDEFPTHARSGPDWASYTSNWFTQFERFEDKAYMDKINVGIGSLYNMPHKMLSGCCFGYDPESGKLFYMGEDTYGYHLAICMGGPQVWMEMIDELDDDRLRKMMVEFGEFYYLPHEEKIIQTCKKISKDWAWPMLATTIVGFAAKETNNMELAKQVWNILLYDEHRRIEMPLHIKHTGNISNIKPIKEAPHVATNTVSQWSLNTIICLELLGDKLEKLEKEGKLI